MNANERDALWEAVDELTDLTVLVIEILGANMVNRQDGARINEHVRRIAELRKHKGAP